MRIWLLGDAQKQKNKKKLDYLSLSLYARRLDSYVLLLVLELRVTAIALLAEV